MARQQEENGRQDSGVSAEDSVDGSPGRESREQLITPRAPLRSDAEDPFRTGSPLAVIRRFSEDIDQLCQSFGATDSEPLSSPRDEESSWPSLEVSQTHDKLIVQARLAGLQKDDIDVELRGSELCISGKRRMESTGSERDESGSFRRIVPLPKRVSADSVSASFDAGILRIEVRTSSPASSSGRRIEVRSGQRR
jgi:HSP20 family molecular chaperone IbpA